MEAYARNEIQVIVSTTVVEVGVDDASVIAEAIEEKYPDVDGDVNDGGQPIYYYVISVE